MAMTLADFCFAVSLVGQGTGLEFAGPSAEAHGAAHFVHAEEFAQFVNHAVRSLRLELGAVGLFEASHVAGVFNSGALHAETNSEERDLVFAGVLNGVHHSLNATLAESAGDEDAVVAAQASRSGFG